MEDDKLPIAKVSGSALIDELRQNRAILNEINRNILRLTATMQSQKNTIPAVARPPVAQAPPPNPAVAAAAAQARSMYPGMAGGDQHNGKIHNGVRLSGIEDPAWMNQPVPVQNI